jgi:hypothetical protein
MAKQRMNKDDRAYLRGRGLCEWRLDCQQRSMYTITRGPEAGWGVCRDHADEWTDLQDRRLTGAR